MRLEIKKAKSQQKIYFSIDLFNEYLTQQRLDDAFILINKLIASTKNNDSLNLYTQVKKARLLFLQANFTEGKKFLEKLLLNKHINSFQGIKADALGSLGMHIGRLGDFKQAIVLHNEAIKIYQEQNNLKGLSRSLNHIAGIYYDQSDFNEAIVYFKKALAISVQSGDLFFKGNMLNNIGSAYENMRDYKMALNYYQESLVLNLSLNNKKDLLYNYSNLSSINQSLNKLEEAIAFSDKAMDLLKESKDTYTRAAMLQDRGALLVKLKDYKGAIECLNEAIMLAKKTNSPLILHRCYNVIGSAYEKIGDYKSSTFYYKAYLETRDSIISESALKNVTKENLTYVFNSEKFKDSLINIQKQKGLEQEALKQKESKIRQQIVSTISICFLCIAFVLLFIIRRQYKKSKEVNALVSLQNTTIQEQKDLVEEKNKEIVDSINYAMRIQNAILPSHNLLKSYFNDYFLIYKPKDIVAGDFYWAEQKNNVIYLAVADCTGHGVPGAIVSVICSNALQRALFDFNLILPNEILDKTRELVAETFDKSHEIINDGMDISLMSIEQNEHGTIVNWSGANTPLWYFSNGVFNVIKATKQTIGNTESPKPYINNELILKKGDTLFLFTDGYYDQFGGEHNTFKGKKFKSKNLKNLLVSINTTILSEQKKTLEKMHTEWKGSLEQVDDITIFALRV